MNLSILLILLFYFMYFGIYHYMHIYLGLLCFHYVFAILSISNTLFLTIVHILKFMLSLLFTWYSYFPSIRFLFVFLNLKHVSYIQDDNLCYLVQVIVLSYFCTIDKVFFVSVILSWFSLGLMKFVPFFLTYSVNVWEPQS